MSFVSYRINLLRYRLPKHDLHGIKPEFTSERRLAAHHKSLPQEA
jgi:hypothetical protein